MIVFVTLVVCVIAVYIVQLQIPEEKRLLPNWIYGLPVIVMLVFLISIVTYFSVKLWLEGELSAFDDIDRAWRAGVAELERHGLDLREIPLFLLLGSEG